MSAKQNKPTEEEDVLDFLDSLPDGQKSGNASSDKTGGADKKKGGNDNNGDRSDILDFLDELAQESNATTNSLKPAKNAPSATEDKSAVTAAAAADLGATTAPAASASASATTTTTTAPEQKVTADKETNSATETETTAKESQNDEFGIPLPSISGWWGNSGSKQLNSFWGSASNVVGDLSKTAQSTVHDISKVANDQFKDLNLVDAEDYEKLPELLKARGEALSKGININDTNNPINKVGGLFSSFVSTINEQIKNTTQTINSHDEVLKIFIINDELKNFNYIDYLIYNKFHKVVNQVEGSIDLEIINSKNFSKLLNILDLTSLTNNDNDLKPKSVEFFRGNALDAEKLSFANIDDGIKTLMQIKKKEKAEKESAKQEQNEEAQEHPEQQQEQKGNVSHIFLTILPIIQDRSIPTYSSNFEEIVKIDETSTESFQFLITLKDLEHKFSIVTKSQPFPLKWAQWLTTNTIQGKNENTTTDKQKQEEKTQEDDEDGIEPADWVKDWIKDGLALSFGVLAQSYVTKRMGL